MAFNLNNPNEDDIGDFDLAKLFGIDNLPAAAGQIVPTEDFSEVASGFAPRVPSSPVINSSDEFNTDEFCESVGLESIWNDASGTSAYHPEVQNDLSSCGLGVNTSSSTKLTHALKHELETDFSGDAPIMTKALPVQKVLPRPLPDAPCPKKMIEIDGFKVTAPQNGKPLYSTPTDVHEETIQSIFPEWTLRLERSDFNKWKKKNRVPKLTVQESDCLRKYRRTMLARVYADRARHRRTAKHVDTQATVTQLLAENATLRARIAKLEALQGP